MRTKSGQGDVDQQYCMLLQKKINSIQIIDSFVQLLRVAYLKAR